MEEEINYDPVVKWQNTADLNPAAFGRVGSTPTGVTELLDEKFLL